MAQERVALNIKVTSSLMIRKIVDPFPDFCAVNHGFFPACPSGRLRRISKFEKTSGLAPRVTHLVRFRTPAELAQFLIKPCFFG